MSRIDFTLESSDGTRLYANTQDTAKAPLANVLIFHGYGEHLGRYHEVMDWFVEHNYKPWALDFRGHGRSAGHRAYTEKYDLYLEDAQALVDQVGKEQNELPLFLLGHSQGGLIGLRALQEGVGKYRAAILSAPAMRVALEANPIKVAAGKLLSRIFPKLNLPPEIPNDYLCRDPERVAAYGSDPLVNHCVNCRWFTEFLDAQEKGLSLAGMVTTPTLVVHPTADQIISPLSVLELYEALGSQDKQLMKLDGYYHEPLNEPERRDVFDSMFAWLESKRTA